jgi:ABC-type xylose transport system permease subunit
MPPFFRRLRNWALVITGIGTALLTAPVALPVFLSTLGSYLVTAGSVASILSQLTRTDETGVSPKRRTP